MGRGEPEGLAGVTPQAYASARAWVECPCGRDWRGCWLCGGTGELDLPLPLPTRESAYEMALDAGLINESEEESDAR
jgi:hypothetical protein